MENTMIPFLETERLILRGHTADDFADAAALLGDPVVMRFITGEPLGAEDAWSRLLRYAGHWQWLGFGYWAVTEKASGAYVGQVGFADYRRAIEPGFAGVPELGYVMAARTAGQGLATEAAQAAIAWGDAKWGRRRRTVCIIRDDHAASFRVAHKCGSREYARSVYKGSPIVLLERAGL